MDLTTAWVKKPTETRGLDHLGVQSPCINMYSQLLPGITNVTDRARYFSFYPWLIWRLEERSEAMTVEDFRQQLRRADCLFTVVAHRHSQRSQAEREEEDAYRHEVGTIGTNTLHAPVSELKDDSEPLGLSTYATEKPGSNRYFKNPLGGLGQYYIGALHELGFLERQGGVVRCTRERGVPAAEAMDMSVPGDRFFAAIDGDLVSAGALDELSAFCPCSLLASPVEQSYLLDLFFGRTPEFREAGEQRRLSLALLLQLAVDLQENPEIALDPEVFRACAYSKGLPDAQPWLLPGKLEHTQAAWALYQRNELLSVCAQAIFAFALQSLSSEPLFAPEHGHAFASWLMTRPETRLAIEGDAGRSFVDAVRKAGDRLPPLQEWQDPGHEVQVARELASRKYEIGTEPGPEQLRLALDLLAKLVARDPELRLGYAGLFAFSQNYFTDYPINLESLHHHSSRTWQDLEVTDLVLWLVKYWGVDVHLQVALRKLRYQSESTFQIRPTDRGLEVCGVPHPVFTNPRVRQALQILTDLGALEDADGVRRATPLGRELLHECLRS